MSETRHGRGGDGATANQARPPWLILADDLTGCLDTAVAFVRPGHPVRAHLGAFPGARLQVLPGDRAVGVDIETRRLSPGEAAGSVLAALEQVAVIGEFRLYKKLDSVLRGPFEAEVDACRQASGGGLAVVSPAVPSAGRTTRSGVQHVHGRPLPEGSLLKRLEPFGAGHAGLPLVRRGVDHLIACLDDSARMGRAFLVVDAEEESDLAILAEALWRWNGPSLLVGAAGLARAIALLEYPGCPPTQRHMMDRPLIATASFHPSTRLQIKALLSAGRGEAIYIPMGAPSDGARGSGRRPIRTETVKRAARILDSGSCPVLCFEQHEAPETEDPSYARLLGEVAAAVVRELAVDSLILSGGDGAYATLRELGAARLVIDGLALSNAPTSRIADGPVAGLRVITKSGGFGDADAFLQMIAGAAKH